MKNLKTLLLPAIMVLAGAGSAYATHLTKDDSKVTRTGYAFHPGETPKCVQSSKLCDTNGSVICTGNVGMGSETLYDINGTSCPNVLKERIVK
ncbi:hypothetical protein SAMN05421876_1098 [Kaistella jeonii]|uniref:DUF2282 domain-containing protein n=3 Tax=Kaistella jeonii TaxID=266749 RepID=A0A0C1F9C3_9FLAO|nr:hypothetical protein OA86_10760 [Kaistella jeonii]SFC19501.1 hypothetical protein SAMN05421876_1098 [Kaistella jeonii]VEI97029.1 Uncharacterised protein [Kaistella jeonii]